MSNFDLVYQAAKKRDAKKISLLRLKDNSYLYEKKGLALTPAGQCAEDGDWESACWLMTEFNDSIDSILYGAVIGGHIKSMQPSMDALPEPLKIIINKRDWYSDREMLKAFAQSGDITVLSQYLKDNEKIPPGAIKAAVHGAAYGNQVDVINLLLEKFPENRDELLCCVLEGAAWGGHQELLLRFLNQYNRGKNILFREIDCHAMWAIMRGCGSGGQVELLTFLKSHYTHIHSSDLYDAFKSAVFYNQDDFVMTELKQDHRLIEYAQYATAVMRRIDFLEQLLTKESDFSGIAIFIKDQIISTNALFTYLIAFTKPEFVPKVCKALVARKEIDATIIENIAQIEKNALKVIDLKNRYGITTHQARFLYEHPEILPLIVSTQYDTDGLYNLVKDKEDLNYWQFVDLVKRVQKNKAKSQLVDDLEDYLNTKSLWWYNHRSRCASFLEALKETRSHKACRSLVGEQFRLFAAPPAPSPSATQDTPKHASAVKQNAVKDEYYDALKKFHDSFIDDEKTRNDSTSMSFI
ncbi:hypothetical protein [Legionella maioricensis]|uniref:Ankyrin repeats (3 copies) n=1 Tax=Legionella maioricensis TaxID=2896528 RepID=A0A9X2D189_9GAMM|nr:hypothetical protein [Legionella maioricensis]MCL9684541.1 hypothetical protein [Legionella maioricensis]MCL9687865.1 hypothetical protein [Legionella maioricensis]